MAKQGTEPTPISQDAPDFYMACVYTANGILTRHLLPTGRVSWMSFILGNDFYITMTS